MDQTEAEVDEIAGALWEGMNAFGSLAVAGLTPKAREVAALLIRNGTAKIRAGRLYQMTAEEQLLVRVQRSRHRAL